MQVHILAHRSKEWRLPFHLFHCKSICTKHTINIYILNAYINQKNVILIVNFLHLCWLLSFSPPLLLSDQIPYLHFSPLLLLRKIKAKLATANSLWQHFKFPDSAWGEDTSDYQGEVWKQGSVTMPWKATL